MDRFDIGAEVARGPLFVAREARDTQLDADVLVVDIDLGGVEDAELRDSMRGSLLSAVDGMSAVEHENVVRLLSSTVSDDGVQVVFERPEGAALGVVLEDGVLPVEAMLETVSQVLAGAHALNQAEVVAFSLGPQAITLTAEGTAKVGGLFALPGLHELAGLTPEKVLPTISYLAPEELDGDPGDARSTVFSAGVLLYRMLSGSNPFDAGQIPATMYRIKCEAAPALDPAVVDEHAFLAPLVMKAMAKDPALRYADAGAMRSDLEGGVAPDVVALLAAGTVPPMSDPPVAPVGPASPRKPLSPKMKIAALAVAGLLLLGGVAFGGNAYMQKKQADEKARQVAIIAEGRVMAGYVARLKSMRSELGSCITAVDAKAKSNSAALKSWDADWKRRQAKYKADVAAVDAHNNAERVADAAGVYTYTEYSYWTGYTTYTQDTYTPDFWKYPAAPKKPGKVKVDLTAENARLASLETNLNALRSEIASSTAGSRFFGPVYQALDPSAVALSGLLGDTRTMMAVVVTQKSDRGAQMVPAKITAINLGSLDAPFQKLDAQVTSSLARLNVSLQQILAKEATGTVSAAATATPVVATP